MKPNIYLDIDGVILANENNTANYADEFITYLVNNYPVIWATTHCMQSDAHTAVNRIAHLFKPEAVELLKKIRASQWSVAKTELFDFTKPFLWFDDDCFPDEREAMVKNGCLDNWIEIDLFKNENQLKELLDNFPKATEPRPRGIESPTATPKLRY